MAAEDSCPVCANLATCQSGGQSGSVLWLSVPSSLSFLPRSLARWRLWFSAGLWQAVQTVPTLVAQRS